MHFQRRVRTVRSCSATLQRDPAARPRSAPRMRPTRSSTIEIIPCWFAVIARSWSSVCAGIRDACARKLRIIGSSSAGGASSDARCHHGRRSRPGVRGPACEARRARPGVPCAGSGAATRPPRRPARGISARSDRPPTPSADGCGKSGRAACRRVVAARRCSAGVARRRVGTRRWPPGLTGRQPGGYTSARIQESACPACRRRRNLPYTLRPRTGSDQQPTLESEAPRPSGRFHRRSKVAAETPDRISQVPRTAGAAREGMAHRLVPARLRSMRRRTLTSRSSRTNRFRGPP